MRNGFPKFCRKVLSDAALRNADFKAIRPGMRLFSGSTVAFLFCISLLAVVLMSCSVSPGRPKSSDLHFQAKLLEAIPGRDVIAAGIGGEHTVSTAYTLRLYNGNLAEHNPTSILTDFLSRNEERGLNASKIYFHQPFPGRAEERYMVLEFPGCLAGDCVSALSVSEVEFSNELDFSAFYAPLNNGLHIEVFRLVLDGVLYTADLEMAVDKWGRVMRYEITSFRGVREGRERVHVYFKNIVLGTESEIWFPTRSEVYDSIFSGF